MKGAFESSPERRLSDAEIALIKTLLARGMSKTKIQAYFTHPDKPVNFGRITNIEQGTYGRSVPSASNNELDAFLAQWTRQRGTAVDKVVEESVDLSGLPRVDPRRLRAMFSKSESGRWALLGQESEEVECKRSMRFDNRILRAIAAFANNCGGYILFGVEDAEMAVVGVPPDLLDRHDVARTTMVIRSSMEPMPRFDFGEVSLDGLRVAALYVHPETFGPVIASRDEQSFREGTIYYRYPGESRAIRPPEFRKILEERDRRTRNEAGRVIQQVLELGEKAAVVDVRESVGSPERIVREGIDEADVLRNFVRGERVQYPLMYIAKSCHTPKRWLPVFYFAKQAGITRAQLQALISSRDTNYLATKRAVLKRIEGSLSAHIRPSAKSQEVLDGLRHGNVPTPTTAGEATQIATAIAGLGDASLPIETVLPLLRACVETARDAKDTTAVMWSLVYKGAARLDELYFDLDA